MTGAGDVLQLRPTEVLFEEWAVLRAKGISTPQIAVWQRMQDPGSIEWWYVMVRLYNNATYQALDLILRDGYTGKYVMFVPAWPSDPTIIPTLARNNIVAVFLWANLSPAQFASGMWVFMSPCTANGTGPSSNVAGTICNQPITTNSPLGPHGTALTVSPSYQLGYSSLPFQAATRLGGLTLRSQVCLPVSLACLGNGLACTLIGLCPRCIRLLALTRGSSSRRLPRSLTICWSDLPSVT